MGNSGYHWHGSKRTWRFESRVTVRRDRDGIIVHFPSSIDISRGTAK